MKKIDLISIVVPIYNVQKYINRCIDSIINQTYKNLEIILVDDGSPDNCPKICDDYAEQDFRIKVIHKKNGGLSDARNYGINIATGKYICFIDSDDYVESEYIKKLYDAIIENNSMISQCGIKIVDEYDNYLQNLNYSQSFVTTGRNLIVDTYVKKNIENTVVWNRMYATSIMKKNLYPVGKIHEDEYVTYKILYEQKIVPILSDCLYNYRKVEKSIMSSNYSLKRLDAMDALRERITFFRKNNDRELELRTVIHYLWFLRHNYYEIKKNLNDIKKMQELKKEYNIYFKKYIFNKYYTIKDFIKCFTFYSFPKLNIKIFKGC